jgi:putative SOS response-associated peptidase YedK
MSLTRPSSPSPPRAPATGRGTLAGVCGRYAASRNPDDLVEEFEIDQVVVPERLEPDFNVAPTKAVYAVLTRRGREQPEDAPALRQLRVLRWGLVPSWAKDPSIGSRLINARTETVADKPAFRKAFARRRCLLPADGYYEWYAPQGAGAGMGKQSKQSKQPFYIHPRDGGVLAMAGIYEFWREPDAGPDDAGAWLWTCAVLTTEAEDSLGRIHDRMPLFVEPGQYGSWLDPLRDDPADLLGLLVPAAPGRLDAHPVATLVNNHRNNGPELIVPLAPEAE